jgi:molybdopterin biosynthesis enzyme MoaB
MDYVLKSSIHTVIGETIIADIRSQRSAYYFFVGGLDTTGGTGTTSADDTYTYELGVRNQMVSLKKIQDSDVSFVVPRIDWTSGSVYDQYDDYAPDYLAASGASSIASAQFYVVTDEYKVYKCLFNNNGVPSTVKPTSTLATPFYSSDGYRWKFMYLIPLSARNRFMNNAFIPVQTALLDNFYSAGQILTTAILNKGTGYTTASILIDGDGQGAILTPVISGGQIIQVIVTNPGTGYTYANLTVSGNGTGANVVATLSVGDLDTAQADVELLAQRGTIEAYRITNGGAGYQALSAQTSGLTNGTTNQFQITDGGAVVNNGQNVAIYRNNWQGNQQQYTSPRTNYLSYSQQFDNAAWTKSNMTVIANAITAPDGTVTAEHIGDTDTTTTTRSLQHLSNTTANAAAPNTYSIFVKKGERNYVILRMIATNATTNYCTAWFDINTGVVSGTTNVGSAVGTTASITPYPNGWYRLSITGTPNPGVTSQGVACFVAAPVTLGNSSNYTGVTGSGIYVWGAQHEDGSVMTSYIPTTTAAITQTDITLTADGRVTFTNNPSNGDYITWSGKYIPSIGGVAINVVGSPVVSLDTLTGPTVAIDGDGTDAAGYPIISNGQIAGIIVTNPGKNYTYAKVTISGNGQNATAVPIYAPPGGHGKNAINELFATRLCFFSNLLNDNNQGIAVSNRFTTIGLLRNPSEYASDRFYSAAAASGCNVITFNGPAPAQSDLLTDRTTGNRFQVVQVSGTNLLLQNLDNYELPSNSSLLNNNSGGQITATYVTDPSIDKFSGDLMFIDNFAINQQAGQQIIIFKTTLKF